MEVFDNFEALASLGSPVVLASGVFDGVHLGHQAVLAEAKKISEQYDAKPVALTFEPHPAAVLRPEKAPRLLISSEHKRRLIAAQGMAALVEMSFTPEFAALEAEEFIRDAHRRLNGLLAGWCAGESWTFGRGRSGSMALLARTGRQLGFAVRPVKPFIVAGRPASSSRVRQALAAGDLTLAAELLGRPFSVLGIVAEGRKLGRQFGFPTANLPLPESRQLPPFGVYIGKVQLPSGELHPAALNLGIRPTLQENHPQPLLEAHLLDWSGTLYGSEIEVQFLQMLRPERKFDSLKALQTQIENDVRAVKQWFHAPNRQTIG